MTRMKECWEQETNLKVIKQGTYLKVKKLRTDLKAKVLIMNISNDNKGIYINTTRE